MSESNGIIMFNCGTDMIIRSLVALYTLRKNYSGAITFYVEDPCSAEFEKALQDFGCNVIHTSASTENPLIKKISLFASSPYDKTLFLDLDVVVVDKIDAMLDALNEVDIAIPHFENKFTSNIKENLCSGRVKKYQKIVDGEILQEALNNHESINTGVIAFKKSVRWESFLNIWVSIAKKAAELKIPIVDESAFQVLYPSLSKWGLAIKIMPGSYNIYVLSEQEYESPKTYHFCGNKHCTSDTPLSMIWKNIFEEMRKSNISNINSFLQYADKRLGEYLKGNPVPHKKEAKKIPQNPVVIPAPAKAENTRDMLEDKNDDSTFRDPRQKHSGYVIDKEYGQILPHFFTNDRTFIPLEGMYKGRSIFLICNGPSFIKLNRSLLSLPGVMTFGINNGPKTFRPNFWTSVDDPARFLKSIWLDPKIMKFIPQSHFDKRIFDNSTWEMTNTYVRDCPNTVGYMRNEHFIAEQFMTESSLNWGNHKSHGGGRSVMLPALRICHLLGFRKVYLLGCDMKMTETNAYHFDEQRSKGAVNCNMSTYDRLKSEYLPAIKPYFDAAGFQVFNCNPESELKVFPYIQFEDAITEATKDVGRTDEERSWGMYSTPDEKPQWKVEPPKEQKPHLQTLEKFQNSQSQRSSTPVVSRKPITNECTSAGETKVILSDAQVVKLTNESESNPVRWNPYNKVVLDHRNGSIDMNATNSERLKRGLITPWNSSIGEKEVKEPPIQ